MRPSTFVLAALAATSPVLAHPQNLNDLLGALSNALTQPASTPAAAPAATTPPAAVTTPAPAPAAPTEAAPTDDAGNAGAQLGDNIGGLISSLFGGGGGGGLSSLLSLGTSLLGSLFGGGGGGSGDPATTADASSTGGLNLDFLGGLFGGGGGNSSSTASGTPTRTSNVTPDATETALTSSFTGAAALPTRQAGIAGAALAIAAIFIA